jgi:hypothetical protein
MGAVVGGGAVGVGVAVAVGVVVVVGVVVGVAVGVGVVGPADAVVCTGGDAVVVDAAGVRLESRYQMARAPKTTARMTALPDTTARVPRRAWT